MASSTKRLAFGAEADSYDRIRPSYPAEVGRWLAGDAPVRVAELGAGTGLFTRVLVALGHSVIAIEPDERMRAMLAARTLPIEVLDGAAEAIPLDNESVDAVIVAQAHWWFDSGRAYPEIARVLAPGGTFGAVWNLPDPEVEWTAELNAIESGLANTQVPEPKPGHRFTPLERAAFRHGTSQTRETLRDLVQTRASYIAGTHEHQQRVDDGIARLVSTLPARFELPYVAVARRATLLT